MSAKFFDYDYSMSIRVRLEKQNILTIKIAKYGLQVSGKLFDENMIAEKVLKHLSTETATDYFKRLSEKLNKLNTVEDIKKFFEKMS